MTLYDELSKSIEDDRPARRHRAMLAAVIPTAVAAPTPRPAARRRPTDRITLLGLLDEVEIGIADTIADNPDLSPDSIAYDIATSILALHPNANPAELADFAAYYGITL